MEFEEWVFDYLKKETSKDLTRESRILDHIDSLDVMNIIMEAEDVFFPDHQIPDDVIRDWIQSMETVGEFIDNVKSYTNL